MSEDALSEGQLRARGLPQEGLRPDLGHSEKASKVWEPVQVVLVVRRVRTSEQRRGAWRSPSTQPSQALGLTGPGWGCSQAPATGHLQGWRRGGNK